MYIFFLGVSVGLSLAVVADVMGAKYRARLEASIKADLIAAEALKQSAVNEIGKVI